MNPKIIKNDAEYARALEQVEHLRSLEPGPARDSDLELWSLLIERYETERARGAAPDGDGSRLPKAPGKRWRAPLSLKTFLFLSGAALLLFLRLAYKGSYFPPFFEGEEGKVLELAKATSEFHDYTHSWWLSFTGGLIEYNKGFAWALVPFYRAYGYDVRITTTILPIIFGLLCGAFFTLYRKAYPRSSLLSFVAVILFSVLCVSLRRYKWHPVAYIAAISVYLYFLPEYYAGSFFLRDRWRKVLSVCLFALSCYLYFGCFIYVLPFFALVVFFSSRLQRRREIAIGCACLVVFAAVFAVTCYTTQRWRMRVTEEVASLRRDFSHEGLRQRWWDTRDFFTVDLSIPYLALFLVGAVASYRRVRRGDRFAWINSTLLVCLWAFQVPIGGLNNPDQLNWSMIPILGVLLIGADEILVGLRDNVRHGSIVGALLVAGAGWNEMRHYVELDRVAPYQTFVQDRNTRTEIALVMMIIRDDHSGSVQYYLPAISVPEAQGGFGYAPSLPRVDFAEAFSRVVFFENEDDLRMKLRAQKGARKAVAYLSVGYPAEGARDTVDMPLLGQEPEIVHPFEDIYGIPFLIRKFQLHPGPPAALPAIRAGKSGSPRLPPAGVANHGASEISFHSMCPMELAVHPRTDGRTSTGLST